MPVIDVSFNLKLVYEFKSRGDFIAYFPKTRVSISSFSLSSAELKVLRFEVKMTGYDKQYTFTDPTHTYSKTVTPIQTHQNLKKKLQIARLLILILKSKVSADPPLAVLPLRDLAEPF